jgi:hypothetical protein
MAPETKVNGINIDQLFSTIDLLMVIVLSLSRH